MDKYEYNLKLDQIKSLSSEENYVGAAEIADTINWNKIKNINTLVKAGEIYEKAERYDDARDILLMAYDRSPIGRMIIYRLAEVAIKMGDYDAATEYYDEFVEIAPHDDLRYVLKYSIKKGQGASYDELIEILEEFKEQEYTEEWAYELAYLYHKAGKTEKCIEACDELILWFGDGPYVERALELKMLYQPLTKDQEEKYRKFRFEHEGKTQIDAAEMTKAGELAHDTVTIPQVEVNQEKFNTVNLQKEIAKGMQQIIDAKEKGEVADTMDNIKKIVDEIPYLKLPKEEEEKSNLQDTQHIATDEEIDGSLKHNFQEMLGEDSDGQISMVMKEKTQLEHQITGQMSIQDVLDDWEKTRRAAEAALYEADQQKLESAKARALQEAGDIMERLNDVIPKLDAGVTPKELLEEQYLQSQSTTELPKIDFKPIIQNSNVVDAVKEEEFDNEIDEIEPEIEPEEFDITDEEFEEASEMDEDTKNISDDIPDISDEEYQDGSDEEYQDGSDEEYQDGSVEEHQDGSVEEYQDGSVEEYQDDQEKEAETMEEENDSVEDTEEYEQKDTIDSDDNVISRVQDAIKKQVDEKFNHVNDFIGEEVSKLTADNPEIERKIEMAKTRKIPEIQIPEDLGIDEEAIVESKKLEQLTDEQKSIFSYFIPVKGMEDQLCRAYNGVMEHFAKKETAKTGNLIIQGAPGCGKTVLATSFIKVLQKGGEQPAGKIGKIDASALNKKDVQQLVRKVAGGCLIIERAGDINKSTAQSLSYIMEHDITGTLYILEDTSKGIKKALAADAEFAEKFTERISVPIFTNDELVSFALSYSSELGYKIDEMAILALHNRISNIERLDQATTLTEVKEIVDEAIDREAHGGLKKAISILTAKRYTEDDKIVLTENYFEQK
ncbi:MAG: tetratricopeptide repeat protein [Agathobacter sp.]|uniref:tetratricopeptide repeat protein n=1 Tax=Agathobacter sp. TaxID=2021311 RepID=UPI003994869C